MVKNKYISTKDSVRLTGLSVQEIYALIHNGTLPARKAPKSGWRIYPQDLETLGLIPEKSVSQIEEKEIENFASYVADEEHYTRVFKRMTEVKRCLKIATANLKRFNVFVETEDRKKSLLVCDFFLSLVKRGIHVQIVCMNPFSFYKQIEENCPQLLKNPLFELRYNTHNHMKIFIFDDECAYFGSANITGAAIGKPAKKKRNYEAGMLVWGSSMMQTLKSHFEKSWEDPDAIKHTSKRFILEAKAWEEKNRDRD